MPYNRIRNSQKSGSLVAYLKWVIENGSQMLKAKKRNFLLALVLSFSGLAHAADSCGGGSAPPQNHTAADAVKAIAEAIYAPFADYPFKPEGICIDPAGLQVFANVYFHTTDGSTPTIESFCITRPTDGDLRIHWTLGPTPEASLLVASGQNEDIVRSHDFWHVAIPAVICSKTMQLNELVMERDGGLDDHFARE